MMEAVQAVCQWVVVLWLSAVLLCRMYRNRVRNNGDWAELFIADLSTIVAIAALVALLFGAGCFTKIIGGE